MGRTSHTWRGVGVAVALLLLLAQVLVFWGYEVDDAYISYRHIQVALGGGGLSYNPVRGGGTPVEAFSNPLWVLLTAPGVLFDAPGAFARCLGLVLLGASVYLLLARVEGLPWMSRLALVLLCLGAPGWIYWHLAGLETPLVSFLLLSGVLVGSSSRWDRYCWLPFGCLAVTRVDGPVLALPGFLMALLLIRRRHGATLTWRSLLVRQILPALSLPVAWLIFRVSYYKALWPTTYYAKIDSELLPAGGLQYLLDFAVASPILGLAALLAPLAFFAHAGRGAASDLDRSAAISVALVGAQVAIVLRAGGDWMPLSRLLVTVVPLLALLLGAGLTSLRERVRPLLRTAMPLALGVAGLLWGQLHFWGSEQPLAVIQADQVTRAGRALGKHLAQVAPGTLVVAAAGAMPYFSELPNIDPLGVAEPVLCRQPTLPAARRLLSVGHRKGNAKYVLEQKPRYFAFNVGRALLPGGYVTEAQLAYNPGFLANYQPVEVEVDRPVRKIATLPLRHLRDREVLEDWNLELRPADFGWQLWSRARLPMVFLERIDGELPPVRRLFADYLRLEADGEYRVARQLLLANRPLLHRAGLQTLLLPLLTRNHILADEPEQAESAAVTALTSLPPSEAQRFHLALQLDPILATLELPDLLRGGGT